MKKARVALWLAILLLTIRLFWVAGGNAQDYQVYWKAAHDWAAGQDPYVVTADRAGFVFKYPPWILAPLLPWSGVYFNVGLLMWTALNLAGMAAIGRWLVRRAGLGLNTVLSATLLFAFIWIGHFSAGQMTVAMTAVGLWGFEWGALGAALAIFALSAKVVTLVSAAGLFPELARERGRRVWLAVGAWLALLFGAAHAIVLWVSRRAGGTLSLGDFYRGFVRAASSGGAELGAVAVRGQGNHGFTALVLRALGVPATAAGADLGVAVLLGMALAGVWAWASRRLDARERWAGWLALGVVVHPLAWHHSYVLAFPLCALALGRAFEARPPDARLLRAAALGAIAMIALVVPQVFGVDAVRPFELAAGKSWGVVLAAWVLCRSRAAGERAA